MVKKVIRWGFWGTGAISADVARDLPLVPHAKLQAVASRTLANAQAFAARFGVPSNYDSLDSLVADPDVDVIYVATPPDRHAEDCLRAIHAGKPVLCEKPFTLTTDEAERIVNAARTRNVFVMEAMWMRFIPAVMEARRLVKEGHLGEIRLIQANFAYPVFYDSTSPVFARERGGGALLDRGVYPISLACYLLGAPQQVKGCASLGASGVDEQSVYQLVYGNDAIADLCASLRVLGTNEAVIMGELGQIKLHAPFYRAHRLSLQRYALPQPPARHTVGSVGFKSRLKDALKRRPIVHAMRRRLDPLVGAMSALQGRNLIFRGGGYQFEFAEVSRCLQEGRSESFVMPLDDSLAVMRVLDALREQWSMPLQPQSLDSREHL